MAKGNDYIIAIKGNQKSMFESVKELFDLCELKARHILYIAENNSFL